MNDIEKLKSLIDGAGNIVFFGGAGVSTESGIPDFRSEKGLYKAQQEYGRSPEAMISHSFFMSEPDIFFHYYKENMIYPEAQPNAAHLGLAQIEKDGGTISIVTQNIDGLHQAAGSATVYELHGSVHRNYCLKCGEKYDLAYVLDPRHCGSRVGARDDNTGARDDSYVPYCEKCGGMVRPDVVLYEEGLDDDTVSGATRAIRQADLLIVGGTSLVVYPAAGFLNYFRGDALVLINMSETGVDSRADLVIRRPIGEVFAALQHS
ncbi:MAG: NAD-dependent protein deacylase [Clostridiales Family XIII bacterium]|jgi:NAD-dependent deacetylase|nr:NAD-dependent protein deacylase [Clostridiales Family XIII bacterium]